LTDKFQVRDVRLPGHFWAENEVYDFFGPKLGAYAFAVYMALCRKAKNFTGECSIAMSQLAKDLNVSKSTIHQALARILELNLVIRTAEGGPRSMATYVLGDVKTLVDPVRAAQLRLAMSDSSVRVANAKREGNDRVGHGSVRGTYASGYRANAAFVQQTRNKERNTSLKLNTEKTHDICSRCSNFGYYEHKGHPGQTWFCWCRIGVALQEAEKEGIA